MYSHFGCSLAPFFYCFFGSCGIHPLFLDGLFLWHLFIKLYHCQFKKKNGEYCGNFCIVHKCTLFHGEEAKKIVFYIYDFLNGTLFLEIIEIVLKNCSHKLYFENCFKKCYQIGPKCLCVSF